MSKLTKEEALAKIEELKQYVAEEDAEVESKTLGVAIMSRWVSGKIVYQSTKPSLGGAVIEAVESGANLRGADLRGADLRGANLSEADLSEADLYGANLSGANLYGANLYGADLYGADLREAEFQSTRFYGRTSTPKILKKSQVTDFLAALGFKVEE